MPENGNGRLDDHEVRLARLEAARKELEDAFIVMTHLETKAAARVKEHAELLASHQEFIASEQESMRLHTQKMNEFDEKLNALIDIVGKVQGGMESRPN